MNNENEMQSLYQCFERSCSLEEFKRLVFMNQIRVRFPYKGPLDELLSSIQKDDPDDFTKTIATIFTEGSHNTLNLRLSREAERYYAEYLNEQLLYEKLAA